MNCERCGEREATYHLTESLEGLILERHMCDECRADESQGGPPGPNEFRIQCPRCSKSVLWSFPHGGCGHSADSYVERGRSEMEISTCGCGMRFVAVAPRWRCDLCGAESILRPREAGARGYLRDHIYGTQEVADIEIRGILP